MPRFNVVDQDNFEAGKGLELDKDDIVERDTYRDTEDIVMDFIRAGERLAEFRRNEFDAEYGENEVELPIDRQEGFDMATASMILESEAERISKIPAKEPEPPKPEDNPAVK